MRKITSLWVIVLMTLISFPVFAEINFDLTSVGGTISMGYDEVSAERNKAQAERWITVLNFANSGTSGKCSGVAKTFDIKSGRTIEFFLEKCDEMIISANIASGRGLVVNIDNGPNIALAGTGTCELYVVPVNKEVPVKIKVQGKDSNSAWTSLFTFNYAPKYPSIDVFKINGTNAAIDKEAKTITLEMPYGTDLTNVEPEVTIGGIATSFSPTGPQNFTNGPIIYTATDGTTSTEYTVNITAKETADTEKSITALTVNGKAAIIDEENGTITCEFASFEGPLASWPVVFTLDKSTASADFTSGAQFDFSAQASLSITVTAQDLSTKVYTVTPSISTKKNVAILSVNGKAEAYDGKLLSAFDNYYITHLTAAATAPEDIQAFYQNYDLLVLHSNVGGTNGTALATKNMVGVKPIINLKAFFYNSGRWSWSTVAPQNAPAGTASAQVNPLYKNHPLFAGVVFVENTLTYYDELPVTNTNAVQYASDLATLTLTSYTLAQVGETGIQMHEIQENVAAKYLLLGLSMENSNYTYFNENAINILKNAAAYLLDPTKVYNYNPSAEKSILSMTINGKDADINEETGVITCELPSYVGGLGSWPVVFTLDNDAASADFISGNNHDFGTDATLTITVTAEDLSTKVYTVTPSVSTKKSVAILSLNGVAEAYDEKLLSAFDAYDVNFLIASTTAPDDIQVFYQNYDLLVLHSNVAGTNATGVATKNMVGVKPILNLKVFFYNSGRWAWSTVNPANAVAGTSSAEVVANCKNHPIFENVVFVDNTLSFYDDLPVTNTNAIQYASNLANVGQQSHTLATVNATGIQMHEIQENLAAKYLLLGLSMENNNYTYFNSNAINILKNSAAYLLDDQAKYIYSTTGFNKADVSGSLYFADGVIYNRDLRQISVYNAAGMLVKTTNEAIVDTKELSKGLYVIQTADLKSYKFVK